MGSKFPEGLQAVTKVKKNSVGKAEKRWGREEKAPHPSLGWKGHLQNSKALMELGLKLRL